MASCTSNRADSKDDLHSELDVVIGCCVTFDALFASTVDAGERRSQRCGLEALESHTATSLTKAVYRGGSRVASHCGVGRRPHTSSAHRQHAVRRATHDHDTRSAWLRRSLAPPFPDQDGHAAARARCCLGVSGRPVFHLVSASPPPALK